MLGYTHIQCFLPCSQTPSMSTTISQADAGTDVVPMVPPGVLLRPPLQSRTKILSAGQIPPPSAVPASSLVARHRRHGFHSASPTTASPSSATNPSKTSPSNSKIESPPLPGPPPCPSSPSPPSLSFPRREARSPFHG